PPAQTKASSLAFTHLTVIDVASGRTEPDMTVVVTGNRIAAVGKKVKKPAGAQVIDATGKYLIPGFWGIHMHSLYGGRTDFFFPMLIANGITGVREMASPLPLEQIAMLRRQIERGEVLGPRIGAVTGKILEGPVAQLGPEFEAVSSTEEGRQIVRSRKQNGAHFIKVYNQLPREVYFAIADEAKKQQIPVAGHLPFSISANEASDAGQRSIDRLRRMLPACSSHEAEIMRNLTAADKDVMSARRAGFRADGEAAASYNPEKATALFVRFRKNNTWQCPTLAQLRKFAHTEGPMFINDERLKYIPVSVQERWRKALAGPMAESIPY